MRISIRLSVKHLAHHFLVVGRSGSGKSFLLQMMAYELIRKSQSSRRHGVLVIDPHGDLCSAILKFGIHSDPSRLKYISSSINREADVPRGQDVTAIFNPFISDGTPEMDYLLTETLTDALCELLAEATLTTQMIAIIRPCIATCIRSPEPSLATLHRFFIEGANEDLLQIGKSSPIHQHRLFFEHDWFNEGYKLSKLSIKTKLSFFLSDPKLASMLNGTSTIDLAAALNDGSVVLFNLPRGSGRFVSQVMSKLTIAFITAALMGRHHEELSKRKKIFMLIDEFQVMASSQSLSMMLSELRKFGLSVTLASQSLLQLTDTVLRKTVLVNTGLKAVSSTDAQDRAAFAKELGITAEQIEKLRPLQFYLKRNDGRHRAFKFNVPVLRGVFLSKTETKKLLYHLVYESGQYVPIPSAPPPPPPSPTTEKTFKKKSSVHTNQTDKTPPTSPPGGLKPAF